MSKTTFVARTKVTSAWLNAIQNLSFDGQIELDGHYRKIPNEWLEDAPGSILTEWESFRDTFAITNVAGLTASYTGGAVSLPSGEILTVAPGTVGLANNATNYIYVNRDGVVQASQIIPTISYLIAKIVTLNGNISGSVIDLRGRNRIQPLGQTLKIFGGLGANGAYNLTSGSDTLSGEYWFTSFNVAAGTTLNITGATYIYCSGDVNIAGNVVVSAPVRGGAGHIGVLTPQAYPNFSGNGIGGGGGINSSSPATYSYFLSLIGSGGSGSWCNISTTIGIKTPFGGNGGGAFVVEAAGKITITGTITANGTNGEGFSSVTGMFGYNLSGFSGSLTGGGGGSGGLIWLKSLSQIVASPASVLSVRGGDGGTGYPNPATIITAGGGGGGYLVCTAPSVNLTGATINLNGGASSVTSGSFGSVAGGSFAGAGGTAGQPGGNGLLIVRNLVPV